MEFKFCDTTLVKIIIEESDPNGIEITIPDKWNDNGVMRPVDFIGLSVFDGGCIVQNNYDKYFSIKVGKNIKGIYPKVFEGAKITKINIPENCQTILEGAFKDSYLEEVDFSECKSLDFIGRKAFQSTILKSIAFPEGLACISAKAFEYCEYLTEVKFPESLTHIDISSFAKTGLKKLTFNKKLQYLGLKAFEECEQLESVDFNNCSLKIISARCFGFCKKLEKVENIPEILRLIGEFAFFKTPIKEMDLSHTDVTHIGDSAFAQCKDLEKIVFSKALERIDNDAFIFCKKLEGIDLVSVADTLTHIGNGAFCNSGITNLTLPVKLVAFMGESVFESTNRLTTVVIEEDSEYKDDIIIPNSTFNISNVSSVVLPPNVVDIGRWAFANTNITEIDLSNTRCRHISYGAFFDCSELKEVTLDKFTAEVSNLAFPDKIMVKLKNKYFFTNFYTEG